MTPHDSIAVGICLLVFAVLWAAVLEAKRSERLLNPDFSFPHLAPRDPPHSFREFEASPVCGQCGGGKLHPIHTGGPWPPAGLKAEPEVDLSQYM